jgi:hypothetical protein
MGGAPLSFGGLPIVCLAFYCGLNVYDEVMCALAEGPFGLVSAEEEGRATESLPYGHSLELPRVNVWTSPRVNIWGFLLA